MTPQERLLLGVLERQLERHRPGAVARRMEWCSLCASKWPCPDYIDTLTAIGLLKRLHEEPVEA